MGIRNLSRLASLSQWQRWVWAILVERDECLAVQGKKENMGLFCRVWAGGYGNGLGFRTAFAGHCNTPIKATHSAV